jgi:hypothetical protein
MASESVLVDCILFFPSVRREREEGSLSMRLWWDMCAFVWDNDALVMSLGKIEQGIHYEGSNAGTDHSFINIPCCHHLLGLTAHS